MRYVAIPYFRPMGLGYRVVTRSRDFHILASFGRGDTYHAN